MHTPSAAASGLPSDPFDPSRVSAILRAPARLSVLGRLLPERDRLQLTLDRWAGMAARALQAPICLISFVGPEEQLVLSRAGIELDAVDVGDSICQHTVAGDGPLLLGDLRAHPLFGTHPKVAALGLGAYAGAPIEAGGQTVGAICAIDTSARAWTDRDRDLLCDLAEAVGAELRLRLQERELRRSREVASAQSRAHELIAADAPLHDTLETIVAGIERYDPTVRASVLLVDDERRLRHAAGARLPTTYRAAIDGVQIGPDVGSCGRAAALGIEVITPDIAAEPRWRAFAATALAHELRHCWSSPIFARDGEVLGTFALYGAAPREPGPEILEFLRNAARLAGIAIERRRALDRLTRAATHDALTGLENRHGLNERLGGLLEGARRHRRAVTVFFIDLDRLKLVNDALGHEAGDEVLRRIAQRLRAAVRADDVVARLGGDEFVVVPAEGLDERRVEQTARRLLREIERPIAVAGGDAITVTASIGSVAIDPAEVDVREALRRADAAMYQVKSIGGGGHRPYVAVGDPQVAGRLRLERELRGALERDELRVVFQPIVRLADARVDGVEALLRWTNREFGEVAPADFIPIAEETGLIAPIGEWVLRVACRALAPHPDLRLNVNVSPRQLADPRLAQTVRAALRASGLPAARLALELTETALLRADETTSGALASLEQLGVELVLDDFGTGYSSLRTLKEHPVHALKIDRMFVAGLGADAGDAAIVEAVIGMAHGMNRPVTAEGVEHPGHLEILQSLGCDYAQGYLFGRPGTLAEAIS